MYYWSALDFIGGNTLMVTLSWWHSHGDTGTVTLSRWHSRGDTHTVTLTMVLSHWHTHSDTLIIIVTLSRWHSRGDTLTVTLSWWHSHGDALTCVILHLRPGEAALDAALIHHSSTYLATAPYYCEHMTNVVRQVVWVITSDVSPTRVICTKNGVTLIYWDLSSNYFMVRLNNLWFDY